MSTRLDRVGLLPCLLLLGLFLALVIPSILSFSQTSDEGWLLRTSREVVLDRNWEAYNSVRHPPLTYYTYALFLSEEGDPRSNLIRARFCMLVYPLLLGVLLYGYALRHLGRAAAAACLALFVTDPNILAHSSLITTDLCSAATFFSAILAGMSALRSLSTGRIILAGVCLGLALLAKYTGILVVPILLLWAVLPLSNRPRLLLRIRNLAIILAVALLMINLAYGFTQCLGLSYEARSSAVNILFPFSIIPPLIPAPYFIGLDRVLEVMELGHPAYFSGEFYLENRWFFYPLAFLWKEPIPFILLLCAGLFLLIWRKAQRFLLIPMLIPAFSFIFMNNNFVGLRHVLVIYPFLFLIASLAFTVRVRFRHVLWLFPAAQVVSLLLVAPHYLAYFNEAVGGPGRGADYLLDSNFDWGQDYEEVRKRIEESPRLLKDSPGPLPTQGLVAVSAMDLKGFPGTWSGHPWLAPFQPIDSIGYTWQIYDLSISDFEKGAMRNPDIRANLGWIYHEAGRRKDALFVFRETGNFMGEALVLLDQGNTQAAWAALSERASEGCADERLLGLCALVFEEAGKSTLAEEYARRATAASVEACYLGGPPSIKRSTYEGRDDAVALNNLGYLAWREGRLEEAAALFRRAGLQDPSFADPFGNSAAIYAQLCERELLKEFTAILNGTSAPGSSGRRDLAAMALRARADYLRLTASARAWWAKRVSYRGHKAVYPGIFVLPLPSPYALELLAQEGPLTLEARENLGIRYLLGEDHVHALRAFRSVAREDPGRARSHQHLGVIYYRNRLYGLARKSLERALALNPESLEARESLRYMDRYLGKRNH